MTEFELKILHPYHSQEVLHKLRIYCFGIKSLIEVVVRMISMMKTEKFVSSSSLYDIISQN